MLGVEISWVGWEGGGRGFIMEMSLIPSSCNIGERVTLYWDMSPLPSVACGGDIEGWVSWQVELEETQK